MQHAPLVRTISMPTVVVGDSALPPSLDEVEAVARGRATVTLHPDCLSRAAASGRLLERLIGERRAIYGVTTGYGPLADRQIDPAEGRQLQRKLVYHLASGVGAPLPPTEARALVMARLLALSRGLSAVRPDLLRWLCDLLNAGLAPVVPEKGTVGASGDLTPLAHMALAFMGEGSFWRDGVPTPAKGVLAEAGLQPLDLGHKEGLALVNGTSAMAGLAALNGVRARRLLRVAALLTTAYAEVLCGHRAAWHPLAADARPHPGQRRATALLWALSADAGRLRPFERELPRVSETGADGIVRAELPQDAYTIRCAPQLLGAVDDTLVEHDRVVACELTAVTDNPLVFPEEELLLHAGNFFGQHVSFASDTLFNAVAMLGVWTERQVARVTDPLLNIGLPPFLQGNATGLNSGFMGAQVTASALVAELRSKSAPACIQSVPTNANNQDVVTMGTIAARRAGEAMSDVARILAIGIMCVAQAVQLRECDGGPAFSAAARAVVATARAHSGFLDEDRPLGDEIEALAAALLDGEARDHTAAHGLTSAMAAF